MPYETQEQEDPTPYAYGALPNAGYLYGREGLGYQPWGGVAGLTPATQQGWGQMLQGIGSQMGPAQEFAGYGSQLGQSIGNMGGTSGFNLGAMNEIQGTNNIDYFNNPHLEGAINSAQQGTIDQFNRGVMPQMNRGLAMSGPGAYSSDRAGIAEGLAQSELQKNLANTEAGMRNQAYNQGLGAYNQNRASELSAAQAASGNLLGAGNALGSAYGMASMPGQVQQNLGSAYMNIGATQQQQMQNQLNSYANQWDWTRNQPNEQFNQYLSQTSPWTTQMGSQGSGSTTGPPPVGGGAGSYIGAGLQGAQAYYNWKNQQPAAATTSAPTTPTATGGTGSFGF